eukprot:scaffold79783_cov19-Tisochrysis_lutea.AAC.1
MKGVIGACCLSALGLSKECRGCCGHWRPPQRAVAIGRSLGFDWVQTLEVEIAHTSHWANTYCGLTPPKAFDESKPQKVFAWRLVWAFMTE